MDASGCYTNKKTGDYHCHGGGSGTGAGSPSPSPTPSRSVYSPPAPKPAPRRTQPTPVVAAAAGPATLVSVGDGDTIRVTTAKGQKVTIRMDCIDAPETAQGESGAQATLMLNQLLGAEPVEIRPQTVDRYGRTVAEVYAGGRNVNQEIVRKRVTLSPNMLPSAPTSYKPQTCWHSKNPVLACSPLLLRSSGAWRSLVARVLWEH